LSTDELREVGRVGRAHGVNGQVYVSLLTDPITVSIRFRYATTRPDGTPLGTGLLAESQSCLYRISC